MTSLVIIVLNALLNLLLQLAGEFQMAGAGMELGSLPLNLFYTLIDFFSTVIAIIIGVNSLKSDEENGVNIQLLSFPVKRWEYLVARVLGSWTIVVSYYVYSIILAAVLFSISSRDFMMGFQIFFGLVNTSLIILPTIIIAIFFSFFLPKLFAFFFSLFFMGFVSYANVTFSSMKYTEFMDKISIMKIIAFPVHLFLPRTGVLSSSTNAILYNPEEPISAMYYGNLAHYCVSIVILTAIVAWFLKRKDV
jgi:ABC-type transport system involved in multi-copper enzyme maturation permease subunit